MLLSVVIPVFNVEKYLRECLDSVVNISADDIEIVLVLGHSDDGSNAICERYAEDFERIIKIVYQNGKGLSNARNCAFEHIRGAYVVYFDSDDRILTARFENTLRKIRVLLDATVPIDVFVSDYFAIDANGAVLYESNQISECRNKAQDFLNSRRAFWNVWRYVYRREFLFEQGLAFRENCLSEDLEFTTRVFLSGAHMCFLHNPYYCYRINRSGSLTETVTIKGIEDRIQIIEDCMKWVLADLKFEHKQAYCRHLLLTYILGIVELSEIRACERARAAAVIGKTVYLLRLAEYPFAKVCFVVISLMGVKNFSRALFVLKRIRRFARKLKAQKQGKTWGI
jgi:glycosyltransferase involved in cell wall biosynthesis